MARDSARDVTTMLNSMIASWEGSFARNFKFAPYHPDALVQSVGHDTIERMKEMAAYRGPLAVKRAAMFHRGWSVEPATNSDARATEIAQALTWHLKNIVDGLGNHQDFRTVLYYITEAIHIGFSVVEKQYRYVDEGPYAGQWGLAGFYPKRAKQIGFDLDATSLRVQWLTNRTLSTGIQEGIDPRRVILYTYSPEHGLPYGRGDWRAAYKHWWILDTLEKLHAIALECFGSPFIVLKGNMGDSTTTAAMLAMLKKIRQGAPAIFPAGMEYEVHEMSAGSLSAFDSAKRWHSDQIKQALLGSSLMMEQGTGTGSYALGAVHADTSQYFMGQARRDIESVVTQQLFVEWTRFNYGNDAVDLAPTLNLGKWDEKDMMLVTQSLSQLLSSGVVYRKEPFIRQILGLPPIDPDSEADMEEERTMVSQQKEKQANAREDNVSGSD